MGALLRSEPVASDPSNPTCADPVRVMIVDDSLTAVSGNSGSGRRRITRRAGPLAMGAFSASSIATSASSVSSVETR